MKSYKEPPNGERYPRVGGTRQRQFAGTNLKPRKLPKNAVTPTRRVHAMLGGSVGMRLWNILGDHALKIKLSCNI